MTPTVGDPDPGAPIPEPPTDGQSATSLSPRELARFLMVYKFGIDEMMTKINILRDEFTYAHDYNPIEHVKSRLKTPESILARPPARASNPRWTASEPTSATSRVSASRAVSRPTCTGSRT